MAKQSRIIDIDIIAYVRSVKKLKFRIRCYTKEILCYNLYKT
jgi:hypothetical protein